MFGLDASAPRFLVPSKRIKVLYEPNEFYNYLCSQIKTAKNRVFLASLYSGKTENELINVLADSLQRNDKSKLFVLVDALRGTREAPQQCSASLLLPSVSRFPDRVQLTMYETPKMNRLVSALLPKRIIEGVGLQHMKMYGWDDEIVLSGANLSQDYFTNRQDRYISFQDAKLTDWFFKVFSNVSSLSHRLLPAANEQGFELIKPNKLITKRAKFNLRVLLQPRQEKHKSSTIEELCDSQVDGASSSAVEVDDQTEVYPLCQFTPLGMGNELEALAKLTAAASDPEKNSRWVFTAGYFNVEPQLAHNLSESRNAGDIIVAAPEANGFYKAKGVSGKIPMFYSVFEKNFLESLPQHSPVNLREWKHGIVNTPGGWSYHAKGFWLSPVSTEKSGGYQHRSSNDDRSTQPTSTYIGSSNFTRRSYRHDIECGAVIIARGSHNPIRQQSQDEIDHLSQHCGPALQLHSLENVVHQPSLIDKVFLRVFGDRL